jgi:hypothetical protein
MFSNSLPALSIQGHSIHISKANQSFWKNVKLKISIRTCEFESEYRHGSNFSIKIEDNAMKVLSGNFQALKNKSIRTL